MPKILINEKDYTNPGTPSDYENYSVLLVGLQKEFTTESLAEFEDEINVYNEALAQINAGNEDVVLPKLSEEAMMLLARQERADYNGVYEFTSAQDFINTIGPVAPHVSGNNINYSHYGNQMAYELLKQGYTVLYLPMAKDELISKVVDTDTWNIFRDKANYDFRFVHHGLLESTDQSIVDEMRSGYSAIINAIESILRNMLSENDFNATRPDQRFELALANQVGYETLLTNLYMELGSTDEAIVAEAIIKSNCLTAPENDEAITATPEGYFALAKQAFKSLKTQYNSASAALLNMQVVELGTLNSANTEIANLAKYVANATDDISGRGDCVALIELDENAYVRKAVQPESAIITAINAMSDITKDNGKYCALTVPSVVYNMSDTMVSINGSDPVNAYDGNKKFPGGFHYLACFINSLKSNFREWYAAAGYTRGVSSYTIKHTTVPLGEIAINTLEPRAKTSKDSPKFACNVIANFRGSYYLWGNRTAHPLDPAAAGGDLVASHFLNIRQLCCTIKKQLYVACRRFTFDPNSDTLWFNFVNAIKPTLEAMKADQGVRDYKIMKVTTNKKATLKAKIRIIPIEAVEDFDLEVSLEDSFGETTAVVTE